MYMAIQNQSARVEALQFALAGLSLPVPANRPRSYSTRSPAMNLARSVALHSAQKPIFPATRVIFGLAARGAVGEAAIAAVMLEHDPL